jgi:putative transposase
MDRMEAMRLPRLKAPAELPVAYYHCLSRVVDRRFVLGELEREKFVELLRAYETFCQVRVVTYCVLSNHFHVLLEVPQRPKDAALSDEELLGRLKAIYSPMQLAAVRSQLQLFRAAGAQAAAEAYKQTFLERMWDISAFMKLVKQRFTQWFNRVHQRKGTLWEERFKSVLVEGAGEALWAMAAYIDLNAVRAGMVQDPKDYRWCGYAQALAGGKAAQEGLRVVVEAQAARSVTRAKEQLALYRSLLFVAGEEEGLDVETKRALRRGFSRAQIEATLQAGGRLSWGQMLRCRVRYFSDGVALGTREFVEHIFQTERQRFSPARSSGARPLRHIEAGGLRTLRDLRVQAVG